MASFTTEDHNQFLLVDMFVRIGLLRHPTSIIIDLRYFLKQTWCQTSVEIHQIKVSFGAILPTMIRHGINVLLLQKVMKKAYGDTVALNIEVSRTRQEKDENARCGKISRLINMYIHLNTMNMLESMIAIIIAEIQ
jgi:hypothetical protein